MKCNTRRHIPVQRIAMQGFTLIEFLVASMLAMIVIVAASGTYMITRKLNNSAQERISVQQDIRNASVQMARDARMAGTFGCYTMVENDIPLKKGAPIMKPTDPDVAKIVFLDENEKDGLGVRLVPKADLKLTGLSDPSDGLLFIYGQSTASVKLNSSILGTADSNISQINNVSTDDKSSSLYQALVQKGDVVLSNCNTIQNYKVTGYSNGTVNVQPKEIKNLNKNNAGDATLSKFYASLYVLGTINVKDKQWANEKALLRYEIAADGSWQGPQLLATGIDDSNNQGMRLAFGYVDSTDACKPGETSNSNQEKFSFVANPRDVGSNIGKKLPAIVQLRLKYFVNKNKDGSVAADALTRDYIINTTVRAGNACVNRLTS